MARKKTRKSRSQPRSERGLFPGESKRRSLITIIRDTLGPNGDKYGRETHNYIVQTHRLDGVWTFEVEYRGQTWTLPGKVVEAMSRHRKSIIRVEHNARAREQIMRQAEKATQGK